ncbi:ATP-binding protein [Larkinella rosea]|uniref:histidine kinase n=1 Tax=Larkinella rosea TaxID=2025312 RepID=A0A3P1BAQ1_9BACT|nr:ATP-binding protein [Larkinella rosea]RRA98128.1 response regulator [Larkinella rosea]
MRESGWLGGFGLIASLLVLWHGAGLLASAQQAALPAPELLTDRQGLPQAFVPDIVQDRQGFIWAATRDGLCRYDGNRFKVFQPTAGGRPSLSSAGVSRLTLDYRGQIWITSEFGDLDRFDPRSEHFSNVSQWPAYRKAMGQQKLTSFCIDHQEQLWLVTAISNRLLRLDLKTGQITRFYLPNQSTGAIFDITESADGRIWLATSQGFLYFDRKIHQFRPYKLPGSEVARSAENHGFNQPIYRLFAASSRHILLAGPRQLIWLHPRTGAVQTYPLPDGTPDWVQANFTQDRTGRIYFVFGNALARLTFPKGVEIVTRQQASDYKNWGTRLWVDRSDVLWEGTRGGGIRKYDLRAMPFQTQAYQRSFHDDILGESGLAIPAGERPLTIRKSSYDFRYTVGNKGDFWYNTGSSQIQRVDLKTKRVEHRPLPQPFENREFGDKPCPLATDPHGQIWAIHDSVAWFYEERQHRWQTGPYRIPAAQIGVVLVFTIDEEAFWLATDQKGLWRLDRKSGQLQQYANQPQDPQSLSNNALFCLSQDPKVPHRLWLGTFGGGLCAFDKRTGRFRRFTDRDGLPNNVIYSVIPDRHGSLWMGTNKGICQLDLRTFKTRTFTRDDGLLADEFNRFHWLYLPGAVSLGNAIPVAQAAPSGERIVMGGLEGITSFDPIRLTEDAYEPTVELTSLLVNNQPVDSLPTKWSDANGEYVSIPAAQELALAHDQNYLTAEFAVMQFNRPTKNTYRYRLEGLDDQWTATKRPIAVYTALPPGHYILWLNASNTSGHWSRYMRKLTVIIHPPFWSTWWAYLLYALGAIGLGLVGVRVYANRVRLKQSLALQQREIALGQQEARQLRDINQMKSNFFANITHEFRTPLTLILGPTEQMVSENPEPKNYRRLTTIEQNAHQLLRLINQLLDLSKLEASVMPVHESPGALSESIAYWLQPLAEQATSQGLTLTFTSGVEGTHWFDAEKLERIVSNLTANALKFTTAGSIHLSLMPAPEGIRLTISDTGSGISPEQLPHIFDRFYQVKPSASEKGTPSKLRQGTGIGLALVKDLVNLQGGRISVTSVVNQGTTFVVDLPFRRVAESASAGEVANLNGIHEEQWGKADDEAASADRPRILIVEDNDELALFLLDSLPPTYRLRRAVDGRDGLEQAQEYQPDLIISDVLMPRMDGFALCGHLKTDLRTSHIPVILLTAKTSTENRLEGLSQGADDYLTKPFQVRELHLRVRNQLDSKRRQRDWVRTSLTQPGTNATPSVSPPIDPFLDQLYALIESHLDDPMFNVESLVTALGMSRSSLFRKVKSLADLSVNELVRNYRLKRAAQLLREGHAITETAYRVGFDSPSYFSKCFRELYQLTPREFIAQG